jgi:hypothetical protein
MRISNYYKEKKCCDNCDCIVIVWCFRGQCNPRFTSSEFVLGGYLPDSPQGRGLLARIQYAFHHGVIQKKTCYEIMNPHELDRNPFCDCMEGIDNALDKLGVPNASICLKELSLARSQP